MWVHRTSINGMRMIALGALAMALAGCAKFASTSNQVARVHFRMTVAGRLNTILNSPTSGGYVYAVAIRATAGSNSDPSKDPVPIIAANPNGVVAGQPTHMVLLGAPGTSVLQPYQLLRFRRSSTDIDSPVDLSVQPTPVASDILNVTFTEITADSRVMEFDLYLKDLTDGDANVASSLNFLQINFLTRTTLLLSNSQSNWPFDAIGNTLQSGGLNQAVALNLRANNSVKMSSAEADAELNDLKDFPDINITDWSVQVIQP